MVTPLATQLLKNYIHLKDWNSINRMQQTQFFEVSEIIQTCEELMYQSHTTGLSDEQFFLPAPTTWIEFRNTENRNSDVRMGYWMIETDNYFDILWISSDEQTGNFKIKKDSIVPLKGLPWLDRESHRPYIENHVILFILTMINTPRLVGRRQHMPNEKLERKLLKARPNIGKFPLQAWTEITLSVSAPTKDVSNNPSKEAHLTGTKPLHFCRQHWRVRFGRLERVKAHWRGDPSLGIKRSRYKVTP